MKTKPHPLLIACALFAIVFPGALKASPVEILTPAQMASIKGGFCIFEECEDAPGTGICEPIPATTAALCETTKCSFSDYMVGSVDVQSCNFSGKYTCSNPKTYRQCVVALKLSTCSNGNDPLYCGHIVDPVCAIDKQDRTCTCSAQGSADPCDWTYCSP